MLEGQQLVFERCLERMTCCWNVGQSSSSSNATCAEDLVEYLGEVAVDLAGAFGCRKAHCIIWL